MKDELKVLKDEIALLREEVRIVRIQLNNFSEHIYAAFVRKSSEAETREVFQKVMACFDR